LLTATFKDLHIALYHVRRAVMAYSHFWCQRDCSNSPTVKTVELCRVV